MDDRLSQMNDVLRSVFGDDDIAVTRETTADQIDGWDSMMHINVVIAVEKKFGVKFGASEVNALKADGQNIGSFLQLVDKKIAARG